MRGGGVGMIMGEESEGEKDTGMGVEGGGRRDAEDGDGGEE